jgi:hypothetical protein
MTHQTDDQEKLLLDEGDFQIDVGHHREGNRKTVKQTYRRTNRETERHKYRQKDKHRNKQTDKQ